MDSGKESGGARAVSPTKQTGETAHSSDAMTNSKETERGYESEDVGCFVLVGHFFIENQMFRLDSFEG